MSDYLQPDRLLSILGRHKDVFLFSGHTHWDLNLSELTQLTVPLHTSD